MKTYIKPETKIVEVRLLGSCLQDNYGGFAISGGVNNRNAASRQNNSFDWEEEEIEDSMWK